MGLKGKLVSEISIKYSKGNVFELFKYPRLITQICPQIVQSAELESGHWGIVGSVIVWNYIIEGKNVVGKEMIEGVDEKKKVITYKVIEGRDLMKLYSSFKISFKVDSNGSDKEHLITTTFEYEKRSEGVGEPQAMMDDMLLITKEIERYHLLVPN